MEIIFKSKLALAATLELFTSEQQILVCYLTTFRLVYHGYSSNPETKSIFVTSSAFGVAELSALFSFS